MQGCLLGLNKNMWALQNPTQCKWFCNTRPLQVFLYKDPMHGMTSRTTLPDGFLSEKPLLHPAKHSLFCEGPPFLEGLKENQGGPLQIAHPHSKTLGYDGDCQPINGYFRQPLQCFLFREGGTPAFPLFSTPKQRSICPAWWPCVCISRSKVN